jgi:hypothetical protein
LIYQSKSNESQSYDIQYHRLDIGIAVFAAGVVNTFWGNDPGFGVFILLLSFVYFPPTSNILSAISKQLVGFPIAKVAKSSWASLLSGQR